MSTHEFDGMPLAIGSVQGVRSFEVDPLGRLTGVNYPSVWKPGENLAQCYRQSENTGMSYSIRGYVYSGANIWAPGIAAQKTKLTPNKTPHTMDQCLHGFYAYYDGSDDYGTPARVSGVVRGYGETMIGSRGFRASKAEILALCIPREKSSRNWPLQSWMEKRRWVSGVIGPWSIGVGTALLVGTILQTIQFLIHSSPFWIPLVLAFGFAFCAIVGVAAIRADFFKRDTDKSISPDIAAKVKRNYPDVMIFTSFAKMVKAFPPDKDLGPDPLTTKDFWTQE